jgi:hypothetical protein
LSEYLQQEELWGGEPVHYTPKGYSLAAVGLEALIYENRAEEREAESAAGQESQAGPDQNRPNWVKGSVSEAVRRSDRGQHRSPYGNLKWRGSGHYRGAYNAWHSGAAAPTAQTAAVPEGGARPEDEEPTAGAGMEAGPSEAVTAHGSE